VEEPPSLPRCERCELRLTPLWWCSPLTLVGRLHQVLKCRTRPVFQINLTQRHPLRTTSWAGLMNVDSVSVPDRTLDSAANASSDWPRCGRQINSPAT